MLGTITKKYRVVCYHRHSAVWERPAFYFGKAVDPPPFIRRQLAFKIPFFPHETKQLQATPSGCLRKDPSLKCTALIYTVLLQMKHS